MSVQLGVSLSPVDTRKLDAALARIKSDAKGVSFGNGAKSIEKLSRPLGKITGQATEFQKSLEASNARVIAFGASVAVINKLSEAFAALVQNTVKVEATFAKINIILGGTQQQLEEFGNGIFSVAKKTATSFDEVAEGALELARQGLGVEESLSRVETALKLVRVSGIDSKQAVEGLTAAVKGFSDSGITVAQIADKLAEVDTKFAVSTEDLINGLERASASARVAGVSFDELLAAVTTVQERTQRGGAVIGNAFKTIFARLGRVDTLAVLEDLGISVLDTQGNVREAMPLFEELATKLEAIGLKSVEAGKIIQEVAGVRQRDILISLIEDLNSGQSQFAAALNVSATAAGGLDKKNESLNKTLEALINNLTVGSQKLASVIGDLGFTESAKDILKAISSVVNGITDLLKGDSVGAKFAQGIVKGIGSILTGPGIALIGAIFVKLFVDLTRFGANSLKNILGVNKAAQEQKALQASVLQTLLQNEKLQQEILNLEGNKVVQEELLLKIYNDQIKALEKVKKAAATVTPGLFAAGLKGGEKGVTKRAADGYIASEKRDVANGVGGAPSSAKVVSIPNFAFGGGKKGTMIANTSEYYVPNYAGGGDAIFNQDMVKTMGLPAGAKKINAAGGFIPNFSIYSDLLKRAQDRKRGIDSSIASNLRKNKITQKEAEELTKIAQDARSGAAPSIAVQQKQREKKKEEKEASTLFDRRTLMIIPRKSKKLQDEYGIHKGRRVGFKVAGYDSYEQAKGKLLNDEEIDRKLENFALNLANSESAKIGSPIKPERLREIPNKGALSALSGVIFEASLASIIKSKDFVTNNARFDFVGKDKASKLRKALFSTIPNTATHIDAKIRPSKDNNESFASKVLSLNASKGYIPNFASNPLEDAIAREKAAGHSINQIRINQSGKLRNSQNPMGLAVTNTRDEPTGRIPNFDRQPRHPAGTVIDGKKVGGQLMPFPSKNSTDELSKNAEKASSSLDTSVTKILAFQLAMSGLTSTITDQDGKFATIGKEMSGLVNTLLTLQLLGAAPKIPKFGGKGGKALGGLMTSLGNSKKLKTISSLFSGLKLTASFLTRIIPVLGTVVLVGQGINSIFKIFNDNKGVLETFGIKLSEASGELDNFKREVNKKTAKELEAQIKKETEAGEQLKEKRKNLLVEKSVEEDPTRLREIEKLIKQNKENSKAQAEKLKLLVSRFKQVDFGQKSETELKNFKDAVKRQIKEVEEQISKRSSQKPENAEEKPQKIQERKNKETSFFTEFLMRLSTTPFNNITSGASAFNNNTTLPKEKVEEPTKNLETKLNNLRELAQKIDTSLKEKQASDKGLALGFSRRLLKEAVPKGKLSVEGVGASGVTGDRKKLLTEELNLAKAAGTIDKIDTENRIAQLKFEIQKRKENFKITQDFAKALAEADNLSLEAQEIIEARVAAGDNLLAIQEELNKKNIELTDKVKDVVDLGVKQKKELDLRLAAKQEEVNLQKEINDLEKDTSFTGGLTKGFESLGDKIEFFKKDLGEDIPLQFADGLGNALTQAITQAETLGDALSQAGRDFLGYMVEAFAQQAAMQAVSGTESLILGFLNKGPVKGFATGGFINSSNSSIAPSDTVPAMLTPGEFVIKKSSVDKYGASFLSSLNEGTLPMKGFNNGGSVSMISPEAGAPTRESITNHSEFTFNIEKGSAKSEQGSIENEQDLAFSKKIKQAVTTIVQEESRRGGSLNYLYR